MANHYDVPSWAGKPPVGTHLDVMKGEKLIQKLMLDEKKCYLFGRNPQMNDFCIDHGSCSRVHAAFVYHKHLQRAFLVDLGSTHGTFIGTLRLEAHRPTQLAPDSTFHFGASTRHYVMRQRPQGSSRNIIEQLEKGDKTEGAAMLGLPESETELDNLTEFNTAHNRRISMLGIGDDSDASAERSAVKKKRRNVTFNEEEELINPEDVDPTVGKFRNMIHSTVVRSKKARFDTGIGPTSGLTTDEKITHPLKHSFHATSPANNLYADLPGVTSVYSGVVASRLGVPLPNPAPEVEPAPRPVEEAPVEVPTDRQVEPKKKKYAKEAWPGKKTLPALLV